MIVNVLESESDNTRLVPEFLPAGEVDEIEHPILIAHEEFLLYHRRVGHPPLLPWQIASVVSSVSMASRVSLRIASMAVDMIFNSLKFSAQASLGVSRKALVSAISSARSLHLITFGKSESEAPEDSHKFFRVLDLYTNTGIYAIHASFSLAELLCMTTFHIYSSAISFTLDVAEESVHIFDGLFGETDTSKALAAFICIFIQELQGQDDELGLTKRFGKIYALGQMSKAMTAYCCLQYLNRRRWRSMVKLHSIFNKRIPKTTGGYDPSAKVAPLDMFKTSTSLSKSNSLPKLMRRASFGGPSGGFNLTKASSFETLNITPESIKIENLKPHTQNRRRYNSGPESLIFKGDFNTKVNLLKKKEPIIQESVPRKNSNYFIKRGARYVKFAVAAYGPNMLKILGIEKPRNRRFNPQDEHRNHYSLANHADIPVENVITSSYDDLSTLHAPKLIAPVHYVIVDHNTSSVVVCLRGTVGLSDIVTDLTLSYCHYIYSDEIDGYVHSGIFHSAKIVSRSSIVSTVADSLNRYPNYSLVLTGHSLGGGCAALLTMLWSKRVVHSDGTACFYTDTSKGFPLRNDLVPCLSLGLVRDFRNITVSFCQEEGMAEGVIGKVLGIFQENKTNSQGVPEIHRDDLWYWALLKTLRADMKAEKLYPPGTVFWINANNDQFQDNVVSETVDVDANVNTTPLSISEVDDVEITFSEIVFSTSMFTDHSPHHYEGSLELLEEHLGKI